MTWLGDSFPAKQPSSQAAKQSGEEDFFILKRKSFRIQWPEGKLHKKKGDKELDRMKAESTEERRDAFVHP